MFQKTKKLLGTIFIIFCFVFLLVGVFTIWDFISIEMAKEVSVKLLYTFLAFIAVSFLVLLVGKTNNSK